MNIPYKFRGLDITGFWRYGDLFQDKVCVIIDEKSAYLIEPSSISQLIGYDSDGKEIYEGDSVTDFKGDIWQNLQSYSDVDDAEKVKALKLKVVGDNGI